MFCFRTTLNYCNVSLYFSVNLTLSCVTLSIFITNVNHDQTSFPILNLRASAKFCKILKVNFFNLINGNRELSVRKLLFVANECVDGLTNAIEKTLTNLFFSFLSKYFFFSFHNAYFSYFILRIFFYLFGILVVEFLALFWLRCLRYLYGWFSASEAVVTFNYCTFFKQINFYEQVNFIIRK